MDWNALALEAIKHVGDFAWLGTIVGGVVLTLFVEPIKKLVGAVFSQIYESGRAIKLWFHYRQQVRLAVEKLKENPEYLDAFKEIAAEIKRRAERNYFPDPPKNRWATATERETYWSIYQVLAEHDLLTMTKTHVRDQPWAVLTREIHLEPRDTLRKYLKKHPLP